MWNLTKNQKLQVTQIHTVNEPSVQVLNTRSKSNIGPLIIKVKWNNDKKEALSEINLMTSFKILTHLCEA